MKKLSFYFFILGIFFALAACSNSSVTYLQSQNTVTSRETSSSSLSQSKQTSQEQYSTLAGDQAANLVWEEHKSDEEFELISHDFLVKIGDIFQGGEKLALIISTHDGYKGELKLLKKDNQRWQQIYADTFEIDTNDFEMSRLEDMNGDQAKDLLIQYEVSAHASTALLYVYDDEKKILKKVEGFQEIPTPMTLKTAKGELYLFL